MKIVILEDDELVARGLVRAVHRSGHQAIHIRSISEAKRVLETHLDAQLTIVDLSLADGENGFEFIRWLEKNHPKLPRILISGFERPSFFKEDPPLQIFVRKPFGQARLDELINATQRHNAAGGK